MGLLTKLPIWFPMHPADYEQALLSSILSHKDPIKLCSAELTPDKFGYGPGGGEGTAHGTIYAAALDCHLRGIPPDVLSVSANLGENLEAVGGTAYLKELLGAVQSLGVRYVGEESIRSWAKVVDSFGRLRHLSGVLDDYSSVLEDRENALTQVEDVDQFINDLIHDLWKAQNLLTEDYTHVSLGVAEFRRRLEEELHGRSLSIGKTGWPSLESNSLPFLGGLTVVAGLPGSGKTQLALQIALGQVIQSKAMGTSGCVAMNSYEMTLPRLVSRLVCCLAGVDSNLLRRGQIQEGSSEADRLMEWSEFVEDLPIYIDDSNFTTSSQIGWRSSALHAVHGPLLNLVVDYAELVPMDTNDERLSRDRQVSSIFRNGLSCAHDTGAAVHVLSQYNKSPTYSKSKIASPDALRYGAGGWHAADVVIQVWNPMQMDASQIDYSVPDGMTDDQVWLIITKYKEGPSGNIFPLDWKSEYTRFSDPRLDSAYGADLYMHMAELANDF